jgi:TPR repeat protein
MLIRNVKKRVPEAMRPAPKVRKNLKCPQKCRVKIPHFDARAIWMGRSGVAADPVKAAEYYRQGARKGNRSAQARWGLAPMEGRGVAVNTTEGESWLRRATLAGDPEAAALVGDLYAGKLPPNYAKAAMWFRRATEAGIRPRRVHWACFI